MDSFEVEYPKEVIRKRGDNIPDFIIIYINEKDWRVSKKVLK